MRRSGQISRSALFSRELCARGGFLRELSDRVNQSRSGEDIIVIGSDRSKEALGTIGSGKDPFAQLERNDLIAVTVPDEHWHRDRSDACQCDELIPHQTRQQTEMMASDIP